MSNPFSTFSSLSAQSRSAEVKAALAERAKIMQLCDASGQAVVTPAACGNLPHALRCAIAIRIARANGNEELATIYATVLATMEAAPQVAAIADGADAADARGVAILSYVDTVTRTPTRASRAHIDALLGAGLTDSDVVSLAELVACINFQVRVLAGVRLVEETFA
ncbi:hypothetical protein B0W47_01400 [Komagataeibacter nataicola]|uniref:Alkylhydroperoxidase n=1 Tax=Komagataeibacter nataicola TaxID=265960 RepID=A0A9N7CWR4_9PROT|nr:hypothetical protein [Komagataeibacter nataicola]AQU86326.1 hypothetical protein B0W47_01400 [Komagataeibacter nataicola]PYD66566.1 hypothetical protein CDI09_07560 [Komagataeibacter nataicola]WEQ56794.1 hypothetical protein LV564_06895 [Komagataeibacter nataicola]WNM08265.1 hypothetical protein RI056_15455 [Komagataeibacter nataicola]GBR18953.1 hypothetical protein AA0616_1423 [Komagataeibacter nataicola NRIC 0616]